MKVISKKTMRTLVKVVLNFIVAIGLIWGVVSFFKRIMKDSNKLIQTEIVDVSFFRGRILNSSEVNSMPSSCVDVKVDKSTALAFDSTALLIYYNEGMIIWKPDNITRNVGLCYTKNLSSQLEDHLYYRVKYSADKKEILFYTYEESFLGSAIFLTIVLAVIAIFVGVWFFLKIDRWID